MANTLEVYNYDKETPRNELLDIISNLHDKSLVPLVNLSHVNKSQPPLSSSSTSKQVA